MKCHICGGNMEYTHSDLPFKTGPNTIVIIKNVPVLQCSNCNEYNIPDDVMEKVNMLLGTVGESVEVEILSYAA
jgi:YgiT-type zinc finger domain-containing protein